MMITDEEKLPRFGFVLCNIITVDARRPDFGKFPPDAYSLKLREDIISAVEPILESSEFFSKTNFSRFLFSIELCAESDVNSSIVFQNMRSRKELMVTKRFSWYQCSEYNEAQWKRFLIFESGNVILDAAKKYKLNTAAVAQCLNKVDQHSPKAYSPVLAEVVEEETEPIDIIIRIPIRIDYSLPKQVQNLFMTIDDKLQDALSKEDAGNVTDQSVSADALEITCSGTNALQMERVIRNTLIDMQESSVRLTIFNNGTRKIVHL